MKSNDFSTRYIKLIVGEERSLVFIQWYTAIERWGVFCPKMSHTYYKRGSEKCSLFPASFCGKNAVY